VPSPLITGADDGAPERLTGDDLATKREEEFRALALAEQARKSAVQRSVPGTCGNCGQACLPLAVYCDEDCRADHEHRLRRGQGR
jgi:hypothetical protein